MPLTSDGYPYPEPLPNGNNWQWIKQPGNWTTNREANDFLASIGERSMPGLKGVIAKLGEKGLKWLGTLIGGLIALIPIPGIQLLGASVVAAVQTGLKDEIIEQLSKALEKAFDELGVNGYISEVKQLVFLPASDKQTLKGQWDSLSGHAQTIVIHYVINRWDWGHRDIMSLDFSSVEGKKHFITMILALVCFHDQKEFINQRPGNPFRFPYDDPRKIFAGEGCAVTFAHFGDPSRWNPDNPDHLKKLRDILLLISTIELTENEQEYNEFVESHQTPEKEEKDDSFIPKLAGGLTVAKLTGLI